jgi:hypothetical protein
LVSARSIFAASARGCTLRAVAEYNQPDVAIPPKNIDIALYFSLDNERSLGINLPAEWNSTEVLVETPVKERYS